MDSGSVCILSCAAQGLTQPPKRRTSSVLGTAALPRYSGSISAVKRLFQLTCQPGHSSSLETLVVSPSRRERELSCALKAEIFLELDMKHHCKKHHGIFQSPDQDLVLHSPGGNLPLHKIVQTFAYSKDAFLEKQPLAYHSTFLSVPSDKQVTPGLAGLESVQKGTELHLLHPHTWWHFPPRWWHFSPRWWHHPAPSASMQNLRNSERDSKCSRWKLPGEVLWPSAAYHKETWQPQEKQKMLFFFFIFSRTSPGMILLETLCCSK